METQQLKALIKETILELIEEEKWTIQKILIPILTNKENEEWNEFSLEQAMRDLENDHLPEYTESDLIEKWQ
ncbi:MULTISPECIES: hypothetical protein [Sphaerospermopsis]|jgi:hypothetical protein|uniref:Addiction module component n=1 Tax=Sphaerospermopsis aphanizomenoides LEGE 00250 TaxID=2777972 RepID=A0ABR9VCF2_9CYAN|nr:MULTISPECIES: hypothetical protein [Sphaerospermopsis]MBE9058410.1 hypothetical protein [Sphaerospermopsis sp. LEGE 08334]MBE9236174.1 hypothetical protein [Sphaerospermopsis aphanizomenoides LEGE 00250]TAE56341.1 MAG: hypothetical protein EAZ87_18570 [Nostocales cyanobacterium]TAF17651.1 MAG: hypothetical protein EAZ76_05750 [Nostocales cyanobacterium]